MTKISASFALLHPRSPLTGTPLRVKRHSAGMFITFQSSKNMHPASTFVREERADQRPLSVPHHPLPPPQPQHTYSLILSVVNIQNVFNCLHFLLDLDPENSPPPYSRSTPTSPAFGRGKGGQIDLFLPARDDREALVGSRCPCCLPGYGCLAS